MKLKLHLLILFAIVYQNCNSQEDNANLEVIKEAFLQEQKKLGQPIWQYLNTNFVSLHTLDEPTFVKEIDSLKNIYLTHLEKYEGKLDNETYQNEFLGINAAFDKYLLEYPQHHKYITDEALELSATNQKLLNRHLQSFNKPAFLENTDFRSYIQSFVSIESKKKLDNGMYNGLDNQQLLADWATIDSIFLNQEVNCFWKKEYLYNHIDNIGIKNIDSIYKNFIASCGSTDETFKVSDIYNAHKKERASHQTEIYKKVDNFNLEMHLFLPNPDIFKGERPTIVYFHGGSWSEGKPDWFFETGKEYANKGWVATAVEYRIKGRHGNYPFESVKDAKTAIRWLRQNASRYGIDQNKIVATGNSAGGHLALATSLVENWNEKSDDVSIDARPNVVIVNSAVYDLTVENCKWIIENEMDKEMVKEISPNNLAKPSSTKFLLIHGENDIRCTYSSAEYFNGKMKELGNDIELYKIKDANHFIWFGKNASKVYQITKDYINKLEFE